MATVRGANAMASALGSGATGVYLDARPAIGYLSAGEVERAIKLARANGAELYVAVDGMILPAEVNAAVKFIDDAAKRGVVAVSVSDLGLVRAARNIRGITRIHVSQRANVHDAHTLRAFAAAGAHRVALSPQLTLAEVEVLAAVALEAGVEVEVLAHGPLCVSYPGRCTLSSLAMQGSDSRGECSALCRNEYALVDLKGKDVETPGGTYLLSSKDFYALPALDRLVAGGVSSLRVGGRDSARAQIAATVKVYRNALDEVCGEDGHGVSPLGGVSITSYEGRLNDAFNRGLTAGALGGDRSVGTMSLIRPDNRGVAIGRVVAVQKDRADIAFERGVRDGDVIEVRTRRGRFTQVLSNIPDGVTAGKETVTVKLKSYAQPGDRVLRLRSRDLELAAADAADRAQSARQPLTFMATLHIGQPLSITAIDADGTAGTALGSEVETARTKAVARIEVIEHVNRIGNTPYLAADVIVDLHENVGIAFSEIHRVRTAALEAYERAMAGAEEARDGCAASAGVDAADGADGADDTPSFATHTESAPAPSKSSRRALEDNSVDVIAAVDAFGGGKAAVNAGCSMALVPAANLLEVEPAPGIWAVLPSVCHDDEFDELLGVAERFGGAVASTIGQIKTCKERGIPVAAHWSLGASNAEAVAELAEYGAEFVWLSPELSGFQIAEIARATSVPLGVAVTGIVEVLTSDRCLLATASECDSKCGKCAIRKEPHALRDHLDYFFPLRVDERGRSHLYNSVPLDLTDGLAELIEIGVSAIRLDLETALTSSVSAEVARVRHRLIETYAGHEVSEPGEYTTRGRYFRSVG